MTQKEIHQKYNDTDDSVEFTKLSTMGNIDKVDEKSDETRTFSGWLSTYGNIDSEGDVFVKGAFSEAIKNRDTYPLLFNHKGYTLEDYIGELKLTDKPEGVWAEGKLFENDPNADKVYTLLKSGALQEMSIGFRIEDYSKDLDFVEDEKRPFGYGFDFKKAMIREGSVVLAPANLQARIEEVKSVKERSLEDLKLELQIKMTNVQEYVRKRVK